MPILHYCLSILFYTDAKVVLELMDDVDTTVASSNPELQETFIRQKYTELCKKLNEQKTTSFNEQLRLQLNQTRPEKRVLRPRKPKQEPQKLSSLNPLCVPVALLNFKDDWRSPTKNALSFHN